MITEDMGANERAGREAAQEDARRAFRMRSATWHRGDHALPGSYLSRLTWLSCYAAELREIIGEDAGRARVPGSILGRRVVRSDDDRPHPVYGTVLGRAGAETVWVCWDGTEPGPGDVKEAMDELTPVGRDAGQVWA